MLETLHQPDIIVWSKNGFERWLQFPCYHIRPVYVLEKRKGLICLFCEEDLLCCVTWMIASNKPWRRGGSWWGLHLQGRCPAAGRFASLAVSWEAKRCEEAKLWRRRDFQNIWKNFLLDEVSSVRGEVGWQVELPLHGVIRIQIQRKGFYLQDLLNGFLSVFSSEWWSSG